MDKLTNFTEKIGDEDLEPSKEKNEEISEAIFIEPTNHPFRGAPPNRTKKQKRKRAALKKAKIMRRKNRRN